MTLFTLLLISVIILAGLGWQTFTVGVLDGFDKSLDVAIPVIKNLTQEAQDVQAQIQTNQTQVPAGPESPAGERGNEDGDPTTAKMGYAEDPNPVVSQLANGGICNFDSNVQEMEAELEAPFSQAIKDSLKQSVKDALDQQAMKSGYTGGNQGEEYCKEYDIK